MDNCIFCRIIAGDLPSTRLYEDEAVVIFMDLDQAARGHLLIVPRAHFEQWHELDDATTGRVARLAAEWGRGAVSALEAEGYNLLQNNGRAAGQEVMHVHMHVIPRWRGDGYFRGGLAHRQATPDELQDTATLLKTAMSDQ